LEDADDLISDAFTALETITRQSLDSGR
jgi:hypothetical protein